MSNLNKNDSEEIKKDSKLEVRVNAEEKEIFAQEARRRNITLSEFILILLRGEILKTELMEKVTPVVDLSAITKQLSHIEQLIQKSHLENMDQLKELSEEAKEDLLMYAIRDKIYWMLQQKKFQLKTHKEIKEMLLQEDPTLKPFLEENPRKLYTALDLALEKLHEEGLLVLSERGLVLWKK